MRRSARGFAAARSAGGGLEDLLLLAGATLSPTAGPLLYAAGKERRGDLAGDLEAMGFDVETAILYRAEPRKRLATVAETALTAGSVDGALFYSRRSAAAFALALRAGGLAPLAASVACFCLSEATAEALARVTSGKVLVAERPDQIALFALVESETAERKTAGGAG